MSSVQQFSAANELWANNRASCRFGRDLLRFCRVHCRALAAQEFGEVLPYHR